MKAKPTYEELEKRVRELEKIESEHEYSRKALRENEALFKLLYEKAPQTHCIFHDITERKRTEEQLRKSEERFRNLYDDAPIGYFEYDLQGNIIRVNRTELQMLGYTAEEMIGQPCWKFIVDEVAREQILAKLDGGRPPAVGLERTYRRKDGTTFPVLFEDRLLTDEDGRITGIRTAIQDITKRKQAEEALRESEERLQSLFSAMTEMVVLHELLFDVNGMPYNYRILDCNQAFCQITNIKKEMVVGKTATRVYNTDSPPYLDVYAKVALSGEAVDFNTYYAPMDKHFRISAVSSRKNFFATITSDITEIRQAEAEREKLHAQLNQAQKMESIGSLAGGIAHDFNNLLFPIVGLSEMMLDDFAPGSTEHQNLYEIFQAGNRGRELVQQILSFSRQTEHHLIPVHIQKILNEVFKLCRATISADILIKKDIQIDCKPMMADPTQVHQIAMNLITNAYHAVESTGGTITVQLKEIDFIHEDHPALNGLSGRYAVLSVTDTGTGIDPAVMNKIFDPYFTTKERGRGTGLGLSTVYGIVKALGGDISVDSKVGKGSTVHVYLPVVEKPLDTAPEKQQQPPPTGTEHILLVDDELPITKLETQMLERLGYQVDPRTSSLDAFEAFRKNPDKYDLIISDMSMPQMTGKDLAEKLLKIRPDIPIVICTGFSERFNKEQARAMGIRGYLMKPVVMADMAKEVRRILDDVRATRC